MRMDLQCFAMERQCDRKGWSEAHFHTFCHWSPKPT